MKIETIKVFRPVPLETFRDMTTVFTVGQNKVTEMTLKDGYFEVHVQGKGVICIAMANTEFFRPATEVQEVKKPKRKKVPVGEWN